MFDYNEENCVVTYTEKMITEIVSRKDKATLKAIERYCEENNVIPNIIEKEKLDLVLKLGINEYNRRLLENDLSKYEKENKWLKDIINSISHI